MTSALRGGREEACPEHDNSTGRMCERDREGTVQLSKNYADVI